ncbi:thiamine diphosphokinase [Cellulosilyticum sp. I15G10I2]|uniref:thiamine diphosphokinase n=1 Tax=Cellulosilyticum sp. I15G10I2 TaxID=1892843 RepID=UPI00085C0AF6|nr:thiamine diphosphokinase [Cellulosilyticum sp. I15G10I2]
MKCLIFANGDYGDYSFCRDIDTYDYIICADNGMKHAKVLGIVPDLIVGDFDSGVAQDLDFFKDKHVSVQSFSSVKDETDTEIALDKAIDKGASRVDIYGGVGTRLDHTLANVHLLYKALGQKVAARLINPYNVVYLIDKFIEINGEPGTFISLLPFSSEVSGIYTTALGYRLQNGILRQGKPCGVSNYMVSEKATISIEKGLLLVIKAVD